MRKALMWLPLLLIGATPVTWAVTPEAWKHTAYAYDARQTELGTALADFAKEFGMALDLSLIHISTIIDELCLKISDVTLHKIKIYHHEQ
ncbi:hypothetical protein RA277_05170 [Pseudomonas syringae pv. tagetis]